MTKVLVINANPKPSSLCKAIAEQYAKVAVKQHQVKTLDIGTLDFQMSLDLGYNEKTNLEPDLLEFQQLIKWSEHIVIVTPVWWGSVPAKFKGIIDRTFLPGFAFKYVKGKAIPKKLLQGRTSELLITLDTPPFWYKYIKGNIIYKHLKSAILDFSGIKNRSSTYFGPVLHSSLKQRNNWLNKVTVLAQKLQ